MFLQNFFVQIVIFERCDFFAKILLGIFSFRKSIGAKSICSKSTVDYYFCVTVRFAQLYWGNWQWDIAGKSRLQRKMKRLRAPRCGVFHSLVSIFVVFRQKFLTWSWSNTIEVATLISQHALLLMPVFEKMQAKVSKVVNFSFFWSDKANATSLGLEDNLMVTFQRQNTDFEDINTKKESPRWKIYCQFY